MNYTKYLHVLMVIVFTLQPIMGQQPASQSSATANAATQLAQKNFQDATDILFQKYQKNTQSMNEKNIDATFGPTGLNLPAKTIAYIKNLYWYLEFVTKYEKSLSTDKSIDSITITTADIVASACWQNYLKYTISQLFDNSEVPIVNLRESEKSMLKYLPDLQIAIHNSDCIGLWNMAVYIGHQLVLSSNMRKRLIAQCVDWQKMAESQVYDQAQTFKTSTFYTTFNTSQFKTVNTKLVYTQPQISSPLKEDLVGLSMILALQQLCKDIFLPSNLDKTMKVLTQNKIFPMFFFQTPDDYLFLNVLGNLQQKVQQSPSATGSTTTNASQDSDEDLVTSSVPTDNEPVIVQDWLNSVGNAFSSAGHAIEKGTKQAVGTITQTSEKVGNEVAQTGKQIGAAAQKGGQMAYGALQQSGAQIVSGSKDAWAGLQNAGISAGNFARDSVVGLATGNTDMLNKASRELDGVGDGLVQVIDGIGDAAKGAATAVLDAPLLAIYGGFDQKLAQDIQGAIDSAVSAVVDSLEAIGTAVKVAVNFLQLGYTAVRATVGATMVVFNALADHKNVGAAVKKEYTDLGERIANSMLSTVSFAWNNIQKTLGDVIKCIAYMSSVIVDMIIDIVQGVETVIEVFSNPGESLPDAWQKAATASGTQWMNDHRKSWEAGINLALNIGFTIAATVLTGGGALAIIGFGLLDVGFGFSQVSQAVGEDESTIALKKDQQAFVDNYRQFVNNAKIMIPQVQNALSQELEKKYDSQTSNMERSLGFYQNYLTNNYQENKDALSSSLGQFELALLTPDPTTQGVPADPGTLYGFKTGWLDLNPGQGFTLYSKGRNTYSQEIAQAPDIVTGPTGQQEPKFWFNQKLIKDVQSDATSTLDVEVKWQAIYTLDTFYIGLYLGGNSLDLQALQKTQQADTDSAHLAKMLVYKKENPQAKVTFGVYEHESTLADFTKNNGWTSSHFSAPAFQIGTWYHMKAQLNNDTLNFKIWLDDKTEPSQWSTLKVSTTEQRTLGVIYSGASIQFDIIKPQDSPVQVPSIRGPYQGQDETDRELQIRKSQSQIENPVFGSIKLAPLSYDYLANEQYLYTTQSTSLVDSSGAITDDYVIFATSNGQLSNVGTPPQSKANVVISLISVMHIMLQVL